MHPEQRPTAAFFTVKFTQTMEAATTPVRICIVKSKQYICLCPVSWDLFSSSFYGYLETTEHPIKQTQKQRIPKGDLQAITDQRKYVCFQDPVSCTTQDGLAGTLSSDKTIQTISHRLTHPPFPPFIPFFFFLWWSQWSAIYHQNEWDIFMSPCK